MRGHIRRRGERSFEYIVDIGTAAAQRCQVCNRRFWIERKPRETCPKCGGQLLETEERRRAIKGGYTTRKECQAALSKVLTAVEARTFTAPTRITVKAFLLTEWLPAVKGTLRPTTYASYTMLAREHIIPRLGSLQLQKLTAGADQRPLCLPAGGGSRPRGGRSLGLLGAPRARRPAPGLSRRRTLGQADGEPGRCRRPAQGQCRALREAAGLDGRAALRLPCQCHRRSSLCPLAPAGDDRHAPRRGARSAWEDLDMEGGRLTIRRAWVPVNGVGADERAQDQARSAYDRPRPCDAGGPQGPRRPSGRRAVRLG